MNRLAKYLTELVGTFIFLSVIAFSGPIGSLAPLAIGSALMVMVYMGGHVSGAHYNPAVSLGVFLRRKMSLLDLIGYWVAQVVGAIAAFSLGWEISQHTPGITPGTHVTDWRALSVEALFTTALVLVVLNTAVSKDTEGNSFYGLAIGFTIVVAAFAGGPISGGAFNPAVGLGATYGAVQWASGSWTHLWLSLVGPFAGGVIAAAIHYVQMAGLKPKIEPPGVPAT